MTVELVMTPDEEGLLRRLLEGLEGTPKLGPLFEALELDEAAVGRAHAVLLKARINGVLDRTRAMENPDGFRWWGLEPTAAGRAWLAGPAGRP